MAEQELIVQGASVVFFLLTGFCFLVSKRLKSANLLESAIVKTGGWFLIALGILIVLLMVLFPQAKAWQLGMIVVLGVTTIGSLFSGVFNLTYRQKAIVDQGSREVAKMVGIFLLISAVCSGILLVLSIS